MRLLEPARIIEAATGIPGARLRVWVLRYGIHRERDSSGRMLYDVREVLRVNAATRPERERRAS